MDQLISKELPALWEKTPKKLVQLAAATAAGVVLDHQLLLSHDLRKCGLLGVGLLRSKQLARRNVLLPDLWVDAVRKWPHKACVVFEDRALSFAETDAATNRVAFWALRQGLKPGDKVALLMENRPEFVIVWLGLLKIGVVTALINTHLLADGLLHCIKIADPKLVVVGVELLDKFAGVVGQLHDMAFHVYGDGVTPWKTAPETYPFAQSMDEQLARMPTSEPPASIRRDAHTKTTDMALLIYTSGTTGLPKAAKVTHFSVLMRAHMFTLPMHLEVSDRIYCALPLYHTSGGNLAVGMTILSGATLCISRRFSTTRFWDEVRKHQCTVVQYIGEMCRYLMNAPPRDNDKENHVRAAFGNGLRPDVWADFQRRFKIPAVYEFYGSTEGPLGILNACTSVADQGHLGKRGYIIRTVTGTKVVRFDVEKEEHIRDKNGFLQECAYNEVGELICKIQADDPAKAFNGYYKNEKESNKKVLRDVFVKGDAYFRTGDLFKVDDQCRWHFMDRIGDTFRWKGENVATNEVAEAVAKFDGLSDICIYGVEVPGNEGRACMAAMVFDENTFDMAAFAKHVTSKLPSYAVPLFLRQLGEMSVTGTMKYEKAKLRKQGMDPSKVEDKLWYYVKAKNTYERLTAENFHSVLTGSRL